ncbi:MAG: hypothetical protein ACYC49_10460 [Ignavibacteriaceae bacterium]
MEINSAAEVNILTYDILPQNSILKIIITHYNIPGKLNIAARRHE